MGAPCVARGGGSGKNGGAFLYLGCNTVRNKASFKHRTTGKNKFKREGKTSKIMEVVTGDILAKKADGKKENVVFGVSVARNSYSKSWGVPGEGKMVTGRQAEACLGIKGRLGKWTKTTQRRGCRK